MGNLSLVRESLGRESAWKRGAEKALEFPGRGERETPARNMSLLRDKPWVRSLTGREKEPAWVETLAKDWEVRETHYKLTGLMQPE